MGKHFRHLTWSDRLYISFAKREGHSLRRIARELRVNVSTISRELKRAPKYQHLDYATWRTTEEYSPDMAQHRYITLRARTRRYKIESTPELAALIEELIADDNFSPEAAIVVAKELLPDCDHICARTIYRYIERGGIFTRLTERDLPEKWKRKKRKKVEKRRAARKAAGTSIEKRPKSIASRETPGHWEMDCVVSARGSRKAFLTLTERTTRYEIAKLMPEKTTASVIFALDDIERRIGSKRFKQLFRSITVDNGSEFADCDGIERSIGGDRRTKCYYCHPYSSYERGSNEVANRMIRRAFPKGTNFDTVESEHLARHIQWMNNYPRKILNWQTAAQVFASIFGDDIPYLI